MNNIIYEKTITPKYKTPNREGGEFLYITEENNGYAIWTLTWDSILKMVGWRKNKFEALEYGVILGKELSEDNERISKLKDYIDY